MAMVDAVERAIRLILHVPLFKVSGADVFVVGDGRYPVCAAVLCLFLQQHRHDTHRHENAKAGVHGQARHHLNMKERAAAEAAQDGQRDWKFYSIDPIMEPGYIEGLCAQKAGNAEKYAHRFFQCPAMSQEFDIPREVRKANRLLEARMNGKDASANAADAAGAGGDAAASGAGAGEEGLGDDDDDMEVPECAPVELSDRERTEHVRKNLSIVVACHSHAPLAEFWARVPAPKICVTMPCCENYSDLPLRPIFQYDDFETFTPKRRVKIYADLGNWGY